MSHLNNIVFNLVCDLRIVIMIALLSLYSCNDNRAKNNVITLSPNQTSISRAKRFLLQKENDFTILSIINPWQGAVDVNQTFYLVKRGSELPESIDSSMVIFVPVKSIVCMSTSYLSMIAALGETNTISGISGKDLIYSQSILKNISEGLVQDVGYESSLNKELILKMSPDLIMMYGIGGETTAYVGKIKEMGVKVLFNADYLETNPLSKVEWIKLFGALYCKESLADSIYLSESESYESLKLFINQRVKERPKVLLGLPYKDTWYISPGNSYISKMITDAGGDYLWQNTESAISMPLGIEIVYLKALTADYWLNIGTLSNKNEIPAIDQRLQDLPCFRQGNLYNNNNRITVEGGNDYWESGNVYPHIIMKDIATILHPELFSSDTLFYYRKLN